MNAEQLLGREERLQARDVRLQAARLRWRQAREGELRLMWFYTPQEPIVPLWARAGTNGMAPLCVDVAAFAAECDVDPDATLGRAIVDTDARADLLVRYSRERSGVEVSRLPDDYFE